MGGGAIKAAWMVRATCKVKKLSKKLYTTASKNIFQSICSAFSAVTSALAMNI